MNADIKQKLMIALGWFFVILGIIGALLPVMPTTVFLIIALGLFSKSSPRFHQMLLNNKFVGKDLKQWEQNKTMSRSSKKKSTFIIFLSFGISIAILHGRIGLQLMLLSIASVLLIIIWKVKES